MEDRGQNLHPDQVWMLGVEHGAFRNPQSAIDFGRPAVVHTNPCMSLFSVLDTMAHFKLFSWAGTLPLQGEE